MSRVIDLKNVNVDIPNRVSSDFSNLVDLSRHSSNQFNTTTPITPITPITPVHGNTAPSESKTNEYDFLFSKLLESQIKISQQLEQITSTMAIMSQAMTNRMNAESYLIYHKFERLEDTLSLSEIDSRTIPTSSTVKKRDKIMGTKK